MKCLMCAASVAAVALVGLFASPAQADQCNELTMLTFNAPVALPGVTLPAGTYRFAHLECGTTNHILTVTSEDGSRVYATLLTNSIDRAAATNRPEVIFAEMPRGVPEALTAWFYPGEEAGDQLVYPKREARIVKDATRQIAFAVSGAL